MRGVILVRHCGEYDVNDDFLCTRVCQKIRADVGACEVQYITVRKLAKRSQPGSDDFTGMIVVIGATKTAITAKNISRTDRRDDIRCISIY